MAKKRSVKVYGQSGYKYRETPTIMLKVACRGTMGSFKRDASGSDKRYSFRLLAKDQTDAVHLFEGAIDLLSDVTYIKCEEKDYKMENLLSLSGVYQPKKELKENKIPVALTTF